MTRTTTLGTRDALDRGEDRAGAPDESIIPAQSRAQAERSSVPDYREVTEDATTRVDTALLQLVRSLRLHWRWAVAIPPLFAAFLVLPSFVWGREYLAESSFLPETNAGSAQRFAGLAAQLGITLGSQQNGESLDAYVDIAQSRTILNQVAQKNYTLVSEGFFSKRTSGSLSDIFRVTAATPELRLQRTVDLLRSRISVRESAKSGIISISTKAPSRALAESINRNVLNAISDFNLSKRQTRASAERTFAGERLRSAQQEVTAAESEMQTFLASNRQYEGSPQLRLQFARLQRRVDLLQQVVTSLTQAYEQARIDEVRNTPVFTVLDQPEGSARFARSRRQIALVGLVSGLILAALIAFGVEAWRGRVRRGMTSPVDREDTFGRSVDRFR